MQLSIFTRYLTCENRFQDFILNWLFQIWLNKIHTHIIAFFFCMYTRICWDRSKCHIKSCEICFILHINSTFSHSICCFHMWTKISTWKQNNWREQDFQFTCEIHIFSFEFHTFTCNWLLFACMLEFDENRTLHMKSCEMCLFTDKSLLDFHTWTKIWQVKIK